MAGSGGGRGRGASHSASVPEAISKPMVARAKCNPSVSLDMKEGRHRQLEAGPDRHEERRDPEQTTGRADPVSSAGPCAGETSADPVSSAGPCAGGTRWRAASSAGPCAGGALSGG